MEDATDDIIEPVTTEENTKSNTRYWKIATAILIFTTIAFAVLWFNTREQLQRYEFYSNTTSKWVNGGAMYSSTWISTNKTAALYWDENFDGNFEKYSSYDFQGNKLSELSDRNEDGFYEYATAFTPEGNCIYEQFDGDENGFWERQISYTDALNIQYVDSDFDNHYDSIYVRSPPGMQLLNALSWQELIRFYKQGAMDTLKSK